jgi:endonuclease G
MMLRSKYAIFAVIGISACLPISVQAKDFLAQFANQVVQQINQQNPKSSNSAPTNQTTYSKDIKTAGLCPEHYPLGAPVVVSVEKDKVARRSFYLCESNYAVQFDPATKTPLWVSERLIGSQQDSTFVERVDNFQPHPIVPKPAQASLNDYRSSKFDRGHMAPAADMLSEYAMEQSFYLTNMIPQVGPNMNRGIWADLEKMARKWSESRGEVLVVTGPIFGEKTQTLGNSKVWVPTHLYKIVLDPKTSESLAFIMPNQQIVTRKTKSLDAGNPNYPQTTPSQAVNCGRTCTIDDFIVPLSTVEQYSQLQFFPNLNAQEKQESLKKGRMWHAKP